MSRAEQLLVSYPILAVGGFRDSFGGRRASRLRGAGEFCFDVVVFFGLGELKSLSLFEVWAALFLVVFAGGLR